MMSTDYVSHGDQRCAMKDRLLSFCRNEDGAMTLFGLFVLVCLLLTVGFGVDVMRYERERAHLQNTLDRAVLAAADMDQPLPPRAVVEDYFAKAGLSGTLADVQVVNTQGSRTVSARAELELKTIFMHMSGVDNLSVVNSSTASESIDAVEISLVLDVSGSMRNYSRLTNLKTAAQAFVDEMFTNSLPDTVTISIVPYATQVTLPQELMDQLDTKFNPTQGGVFNAMSQDERTQWTNDEAFAAQKARDAALLDRNADVESISNCINFPGNEFKNTRISETKEYERTLHFDPWEYFDGRDNDLVELVRSPVCEARASREMMIMSDDQEGLKAYIRSFFADGNTSLDLGMKWGSILVDPSFRPIVQELADPDVGLIDPQFANRPVDHSDTETIKVIVLMTDGQNTSQYYIQDDYRLGDTNVWWNEQEEFYSVYLGIDEDDENENGQTDDGLYYWPQDDVWEDHPYGEGFYVRERVETDECRSFRNNGSCKRYKKEWRDVFYDEPGEAVLLTYPELWAWTSMGSIVERLYEPFMNDSQAWQDWYFDVRKTYNHNTKNSRTRNICKAAKKNGTIVFTIGFESPSSSRTLLQQCASSPAHFFDVDGLELADAFSAIASSIRALRVTQ